MTTIVYIGGTKGGSAKTTTAHLACLGAVQWKEAATYVLTDPSRKLRAEGRPYGVIDGRVPDQLARILAAARETAGGWLFVDGGGNRPAFDVTLAAAADLCFLPFRASEEDVDTVADDLVRMPNAFAWPAAWATNKFAAASAQYYIDGLKQAFPGRVMDWQIPFVNSVSDLLSSLLETPSPQARIAARSVFFNIEDKWLELRESTDKKAREGAAVA